ncbi:MAG: flagellar hook-associated protein FlgL [Woeseiaceae bacterium]|nr:flagellar hook-associated protein FlgL [Woeseiaceae bacterium]
MRVSTQGMFMQGLTMMQRLQTALDYTQRQISSGRSILKPSDDPIASARALEIRESLSRLGQFDRNANLAENRLAQEEEALGTVNNVLQRVRELALQANSGTQSDETRKLIAIEMRQQLDHLMQVANQKDGNGRYLFSGNLEDTEPVTRAGSTFSYNGDQGQRFIQVGENTRIADGDSGADVFFRIRAGNGVFTAAPAATNAGTGVLGPGSLVNPSAWDQGAYEVRFVDQSNYEVTDASATLVTSGTFTPGDTLAFAGIEFAISGQPAAGDTFDVAPSAYKDVFTTIDELANSIETNALGDAQTAALNNGINAGLLGLDQAIGNVLEVRTKVGSRLAVIETQVDNNASFSLSFESTLADIEDLDYAEALSRLSLQASTLEAAQKSFVRTQTLSLFNYF